MWRQFRQTKAHQDSQTALGWAKLQQDKMELALRARAAAQKDGTKPLNATIERQLMNTRTALSTIDRMIDLAKNEGIFDRANRRVKEVLSDTERGSRQQYDQLRIRAARDVAGSALQKSEQEIILPTFEERSGYYDPVPGLMQARKSLEATLRAQAETAQRGTTSDIGGIAEGGMSGDMGDEPLHGERVRE